MQEKIAVLAYSGGLDTSCCLKLLEDKYNYKVVSVAVDVGQPEDDLKEPEEKAKKLGVLKHYTIDAKEEFAVDYIFRAIKANALYEGYPLSTALARPLIAIKIAELAKEIGADAISHGCTGKGNDQFRFESVMRAKAPEIEIIAPIRDLNLTRTEEIQYAKEKGIPIPVDLEKPFSIDENLWGRSIEGGILENPMIETPKECFAWTVDPKIAKDEEEYVEIEFKAGVPVAINGQKFDAINVIKEANKLAGRNGVGRVDIIEDRVLGLKSRENYECPGAILLITAHKALEQLVLSREELVFKEMVDSKYADLIYKGLWHEPLRHDLDAFVDKTQERMNGIVRAKLYKGSLRIVGRESECALYQENMVSFENKDMDQREIVGMVKFHGLQAAIFESLRNK
ncbi:Argininosuccinate synthase [Methanococcus vannielii SB]|jgi:argininosuccinate synthase|uniref:Argininosuccinate synthase n=1 Tax=Methanococcus vannielii (strain ATCC 35089 / DSM 1224 / JCM 13029 / OCM 148 / SB) TaxID=406327 RepID=A6UR64_METVS|nr:argininosuccinate synthase [Methanococcus vannielii]ABR54986.1 Argininosuccinate synthase [Methanococcus vannielii SB]